MVSNDKNGIESGSGIYEKDYQTIEERLFIYWNKLCVLGGFCLFFFLQCINTAKKQQHEIHTLFMLKVIHMR